MKIAIFSGVIPSTTFIEHLIEGVAQNQTVLLFGVIKKNRQYNSKRVKIYNTPKSHFKNLGITMFRMLNLMLSRPKDLMLLLKEIKKYNSLYEQWIWFTKFLTIVLYKPDILHLQWARDLEFYSFFKSTYGIKLIVSLRGAHINYTPIVEPKIADVYKDLFPNVDAFHAVSKTIGNEAKKYGAEPSKIEVIHSPIQPMFFDKFSKYKKQNSSVVKLLSIGRFHWKKGFSYAMEAIFELKEQGYQIEYTIIGPNDYTEALLFQIKQLGLENNIKLKGTMSQNDLLNEMDLNDMLILSSVEEGIANVILEAMAVGLPVVTTNCGGMAEVVKSNETGWIIPLRDAKAMANAIIEVVNAKEQDLQTITMNAHELVKKEFRAENSINKFVGMYESVYSK